MSVEDQHQARQLRDDDQRFYEHSIHNEVEQFGDIVQVFSTYESRHKADDPALHLRRASTAFNCWCDGERYWVVNIYTGRQERPDNPIPAKYLPLKSSSR